MFESYYENHRGKLIGRISGGVLRRIFLIKRTFRFFRENSRLKPITFETFVSGFLTQKWKFRDPKSFQKFPFFLDFFEDCRFPCHFKEKWMMNVHSSTTHFLL